MLEVHTASSPRAAESHAKLPGASVKRLHGIMLSATYPRTGTSISED